MGKLLEDFDGVFYVYYGWGMGIISRVIVM